LDTLVGKDDSIYVAIDIGTSNVCVLVGHPDAAGRIRVIGTGIVPASGMRKGGVTHLESVVRAIDAAKDRAERTSGYEITSALVSLSGAQISSMNSSGMVGVSGQTIDYGDVARAIEAARSVALPHNKHIVHVIPRGFVVDGQEGIKSAIGMHGYRLEVEVHIVTAGATALQNLEMCIDATGIAVDGWVLGSLAAAETVLTDTEREMGVVVCDIGGGTCDLAIFIENAVFHTAVIPVGGDHLTNDIAKGLHLPQESAELVKQRHGHGLREAVEPQQTFAVRPFGHDRPLHFKQSDLVAIIEPRIEELFILVRQEIKRAACDGLLPAGLVLTGGTSLLPGIREIASNVLQLPVRLGQAEDIRGLVDKLQTPEFAASVGLLKWARLLEQQEALEHRAYRGIAWPRLSLRKAVEFLYRLLPG
jgi:cell division protein FtsA